LFGDLPATMPSVGRKTPLGLFGEESIIPAGKPVSGGLFEDEPAEERNTDGAPAEAGSASGGKPPGGGLFEDSPKPTPKRAPSPFDENEPEHEPKSAATESHGGLFGEEGPLARPGTKQAHALKKGSSSLFPDERPPAKPAAKKAGGGGSSGTGNDRSYRRTSG
jgi:hypothetical protein